MLFMSNIEKYKKYKLKYEMLGKTPCFRFKIEEETDGVWIDRYIGGDGECEGMRTIEIPSFVTGVSYAKLREKAIDGCGRLVDVGSPCFQYIDESLKIINHSQITDMSYMFSGYRGRHLDLSEFDTTGVTNMSWMFNECEPIRELDLSNFDTREVTNMNNMFDSCRQLTSLNVSSFDTRKVGEIHSMFFLCKNLKELDLSSFDRDKFKPDMFSRCFNLKKVITNKGIDRL